MPECAFHPRVETNVSCPDCERWICPKDMVPTPVGYKCKSCAKPASGQLSYVKPRQIVLGGLAAVGAGVFGGLVVGSIGITFFYVSALFGFLVAEAARRGSGGHRGAVVAAISGVATLFGAYLGGFDVIGIVIGVVAAVLYSYQNLF